MWLIHHADRQTVFRQYHRIRRRLGYQIGASSAKSIYIYSTADTMMNRESLAEWAKDKPLSILQLDPADRAVLRIAGKPSLYLYTLLVISGFGCASQGDGRFLLI